MIYSTRRPRGIYFVLKEVKMIYDKFEKIIPSQININQLSDLYERLTQKIYTISVSENNIRIPRKNSMTIQFVGKKIREQKLPDDAAPGDEIYFLNKSENDVEIFGGEISNYGKSPYILSSSGEAYFIFNGAKWLVYEFNNIDIIRHCENDKTFPKTDKLFVFDIPDEPEFLSRKQWFHISDGCAPGQHLSFINKSKCYVCVNCSDKTKFLLPPKCPHVMECVWDGSIWINMSRHQWTRKHFPDDHNISGWDAGSLVEVDLPYITLHIMPTGISDVFIRNRACSKSIINCILDDSCSYINDRIYSTVDRDVPTIGVKQCFIYSDCGLINGTYWRLTSVCGVCPNITFQLTKTRCDIVEVEETSIMLDVKHMANSYIVDHLPESITFTITNNSANMSKTLYFNIANGLNMLSELTILNNLNRSINVLFQYRSKSEYVESGVTIKSKDTRRIKIMNGTYIPLSDSPKIATPLIKPVSRALRPLLDKEFYKSEEPPNPSKIVVYSNDGYMYSDRNCLPYFTNEFGDRFEYPHLNSDNIELTGIDKYDLKDNVPNTYFDSASDTSKTFDWTDFGKTFFVYHMSFAKGTTGLDHNMKLHYFYYPKIFVSCIMPDRINEVLRRLNLGKRVSAQILGGFHYGLYRQTTGNGIPVHKDPVNDVPRYGPDNDWFNPVTSDAAKHWTPSEDQSGVVTTQNFGNSWMTNVKLGIVPNSVWDMHHRPSCYNVNLTNSFGSFLLGGMVDIGQFWMDIYETAFLNDVRDGFKCDHGIYVTAPYDAALNAFPTSVSNNPFTISDPNIAYNIANKLNKRVPTRTEQLIGSEWAINFKIPKPLARFFSESGEYPNDPKYFRISAKNVWFNQYHSSQITSTYMSCMGKKETPFKFKMPYVASNIYSYGSDDENMNIVCDHSVIATKLSEPRTMRFVCDHARTMSL